MSTEWLGILLLAAIPSETVAVRPILPSFSERNVSRWRGLTPFEERTWVTVRSAIARFLVGWGSL